jgi:type IV pilus assembly protein PilN
MLLLVAVQVGGVVAFHLSEVAEIDKMKARQSALKDVVARLKTEVGDYDALKSQRDELIKQRDAIRRLEAARTGPVFVMRELSEILTKDKGPTFAKNEYEEALRRDPNAGYNPGWDPRRVWIAAIEEKSKAVRISGSAKSNDDVAEFLKRLTLSVFFSDVNLEGTREQAGGKSGTAKYYTFTVNCRVNY